MGDSGSLRSLVQWGANTLRRRRRKRGDRFFNNHGCCCVQKMYLAVISTCGWSLIPVVSCYVSLLSLKDNLTVCVISYATEPM